MGRDLRHSGPRRRRWSVWHWLPTVLVLALLAAGVGAYRFEWGQRYLPGLAADPVTEPEQVLAPAGLDLPEWTPPADDAVALDTAGALAPDRVAAAVSADLADPDLGRHVVGAVAPAGPRLGRAGRPGDGRYLPASTTKLLTLGAALDALGPDHTFTTRVVRGDGSARGRAGRRGRPAAGQQAADGRRGRVDLPRPRRRRRPSPCRSPRRSAAQGRVRVRFDDSLFTGPTDNPAWRRDYVPDDIVSPITALMVDGGDRARQRPHAPTTRRWPPPSVFADGLRAAGLRVAGAAAAGRRTRRRGGARRRRERTAVAGRRADPRRQRQRGRRGGGATRSASPPPAPGRSRRAPPACSTPSAGSGSTSPAPRCTTAPACRGATGSRPSTAHRPAPARRRPGRRGRCAAWSPGCRSPGSPGRSPTASPRAPPSPAAWCAPRPAPSPACTPSPASPSTATAQPLAFVFGRGQGPPPIERYDAQEALDRARRLRLGAACRCSRLDGRDRLARTGAPSRLVSPT